MGEALRRGAEDGRGGRRALTRWPAAALAIVIASTAAAAQSPDRTLALTSGRFTVEYHRTDEVLARSVLRTAVARDTYPGLPRPRAAATILIAPDERRFREWIGPAAPEWGAAVAFPSAQRIVMQGRRAPSSAGDPMEVLRHELAHLALNEAMGDIPPRWFDEGYASFAAGEWSRDAVLATNLALVVRGAPSLRELDDWFGGGSTQAQAAYALSYRAVAELSALDPERGLEVFFAEWRRTLNMDSAIRMAYGMTFDGFDKHWQRRTRFRYGILAIFADVTLAGLFVGAVIVPLYVIRRRRYRERLARMRAAEEAAERAARDSAIAELLNGETPPENDGNTLS